MSLPDGEPGAYDTLILGIGNILWADEGFGIRAIEALHAQYVFADDVRLMDGGTQGIFLLPWVRNARRLIIFDAVDYGLPPATLKLIRDADVPRFMGAKKMSMHQTGFQEVLSSAQLTDDLPESLVLIGVQPELLDDYGGSLRDSVKRQIPAALALARKAEKAGPVDALRAKLEANPADHQARFDLATALHASGKVEEAVNELLDLFRRDREWNDGAAKAQLHKTYIIAETEDGLTIIDQHAAHERLVMERMKTALAESGVASQNLLLPEVVTLADHHAAAIIEAADMLETMGLVVEGFGAGAVVVRAVPALLGTPDVKHLVADIAEELVELGGSTSLEDRINHVLATVSCHGSVRAPWFV